MPLRSKDYATDAIRTPRKLVFKNFKPVDVEPSKTGSEISKPDNPAGLLENVIQAMGRKILRQVAHQNESGFPSFPHGWTGSCDGIALDDHTPLVQVVRFLDAEGREVGEADERGLHQVHEALARGTRVLLVLGGVDDALPDVLARNADFALLVAPDEGLNVVGLLLDAALLGLGFRLDRFIVPPVEKKRTHSFKFHLHPVRLLEFNHFFTTIGRTLTADSCQTTPLDYSIHFNHICLSSCGGRSRFLPPFSFSTDRNSKPNWTVPDTAIAYLSQPDLNVFSARSKPHRVVPLQTRPDHSIPGLGRPYRRFRARSHTCPHRSSPDLDRPLLNSTDRPLWPVTHRAQPYPNTPFRTRQSHTPHHITQPHHNAAFRTAPAFRPVPHPNRPHQTSPRLAVPEPTFPEHTRPARRPVPYRAVPNHAGPDTTKPSLNTPRLIYAKVNEN